MGTSLSTLAFHAHRLNLGNETLVGIVLAIPFFVTYFGEAVDRYAKKSGRFVRPSKARLLCHKSLVRGFIPELAPSSQNSVATLPVMNPPTEMAFKEPPETLILEDGGIPGIDEGAGFYASIPKIVNVSMDDQAPLLSPCGSSTGSDEQSDDVQSTAEYLTEIAQILQQKARRGQHSQQIGIADALVQLGSILAKDAKFSDAFKVFKRAEVVQKQIIAETILTVADAMEELAEIQTDREIANAYLEMANELKESQGPKTLQKALVVHADHKAASRASTRPIKKAARRVERRLKRACSEAIPLSLTLKMQAKCKTMQYKEKKGSKECISLLGAQDTGMFRKRQQRKERKELARADDLPSLLSATCASF